MNIYIIFFIVIFCFSAIHFLEMCAFIARYSGIASGNKAFGFALNRSVMMLTRFFTMLLMPLLGYIVDINVSKVNFLVMIHFSLLGAGVFSILVFFDQKRWKNIFDQIILKYKNGGNLLISIFFIPILYIQSIKAPIYYRNNIFIIKPIFKDKESKYIFYSSIVVYMVYSLSVFIAFYAALIFYDYRSSIGQLSAVTNAFATVLLTFFVEPKMATRMDDSVYLSFKDNNAIMLGRLLGVGVFSHFIVMFFWFFI